jgi:hypothetical protein
MSKYMKWSLAMDILKLAKDAAMLVVLDGRIGRDEYRSVQGSEQAFHGLPTHYVSRLGMKFSVKVRNLNDQFVARLGCPDRALFSGPIASRRMTRCLPI